MTLDPAFRPRPEDPDEPPPVLGRWERLYAVVVGTLAALIAAFWLFGAHFG